MSVARRILLCGRREIALALLVGIVTADNSASAATLYESGTLGPTGVRWQEVTDQVVLAENLHSGAFNGVRVHFPQPVLVEKVGAHLVAAPSAQPATFFASMVRLTGSGDFPDSTDLSSSDVIGSTLVTVPNTSTEVFGDLTLSLQPGWYALVFGSGLFGASGSGGVLLNNPDMGSPDYAGFLQGFGWGHRLPNKRFVIIGQIVPEPPSVFSALVALCTFAFREFGNN